MKTLKKYTDYLKDNPEGYWFKRKLYGWGWTPARWQGWAVIVVFILFITWNGVNLASKPIPTNTDLFWFLLRIVLSVVAIILICYKTGESPRWQWGLKD